MVLGVPEADPEEPFLGVFTAPGRNWTERESPERCPFDGTLSRCPVTGPGGEVARDELGRLSGPLLPGLELMLPAVGGANELGGPTCPGTPDGRPARTGLILGCTVSGAVTLPTVLSRTAGVRLPSAALISALLPLWTGTPAALPWATEEACRRGSRGGEASRARLEIDCGFNEDRPPGDIDGVGLLVRTPRPRIGLSDVPVHDPPAFPVTLGGRCWGDEASIWLLMSADSQALSCVFWMDGPELRENGELVSIDS